MAEGTEGQPAPLNPQARADVDRALASAGVEGGLHPKAAEDVDRVLNESGVEPPPKADITEAFQQSGIDPDKLAQAEALRKEFGEPSNLSKDGPLPIYEPRTESRSDKPELSAVKEHSGVTVSKFKYEGPRVLSPDPRDRGTTMNYEGFMIDTPELRVAVFKGPLSGETFFKAFDRQGNLLEEVTFHGNLADIWTKAAETYPPNELFHLVMAGGRLSFAERKQIKQNMEAAGGRDNYVMQQAERLVQEGQFANLADARWAVITELEIAPSSPQAERKIIEAINAGDIPEDITDPKEAEKIMQDLDFCARYPGMIKELARKLPELMRIATMTPEEKVRFAYALAQTLDNTVLGKNNGASNVSFEDAQQLSQVHLDTSSLGGNRAAEIIKVIDYTWKLVAKLAQKAGYPPGSFRII